MTDLLINIDHVATLRNARQESFPDPVRAAMLCEKAGANGIVFHLREDRRHIKERDVRLLKETVQGKLDFELSTDEEVVAICCETQPNLATLVPERREEITTEGGLDVTANRERLEVVISRLHDANVNEVAVFIDPVPAQVEAAKAVGADAVELHTGVFANTETPQAQQEEAQTLARAAKKAKTHQLSVHAGHGLDYQNYAAFRDVASDVVDEVSIGFAVIARALLEGMEHAVHEMKLVVGK